MSNKTKNVENIKISNERDEVFERCLRTYGVQPQVDMMIEEMSELIKALLKWRRSGLKGLSDMRDCIIDELADVRIMERQMEMLFDCEDEVESRIDYKVQRQQERLEKRAREGRG